MAIWLEHRQELQEWDWEMENGHGGATHIFVMAGLHVK
jgi:hypothetical protein